MDNDCREIRVTGRVQGVGFRYSAMLAARNLGLTGYVKNLPDNSVYIIAQGSADAISNLIEWCKSGPPRADVYSVDYSLHQPGDFKSFEIR